MSKSKKKNGQLTGKDLEIHDLREENKKLKDEVRKLQRALEEYTDTYEKHEKKHTNLAKFERQAQSGKLFSRRNFGSYIFGVLKSTSVFRIYKRIINTVRKYTFITTSIKVVSALFALLESSAVFVISASLFTVSLPFTLLFSGISVFISLMQASKHAKRLDEVITNKRIFVYFPPKEADFSDSSFFHGMVMQGASAERTFTIIVSPFSMKKQGFDPNGKPYMTMRFESENIVMVRKTFYFTIKKKIFKDQHLDITELY